ncbi:MarR family winged helix-turn-helix transcriptional regulator [Latilactobacillus sp. 5-91]|uniref:MarR family winged helix-turn-helix transcriptional regulator n=1 Tax=Latilactobacillus sp. 5-91 TaxID=3410924 RepID=UPI003A7068CE
MQFFSKLFELKKEIEQFYKTELDQFDITDTQFFLLTYIDSVELASPTKLSASFNISTPAISRLCRELENKRLIERFRDSGVQADYRLVFIRLTPAGTAKLNKVNAALTELINVPEEPAMVDQLDASREIIGTLFRG